VLSEPNEIFHDFIGYFYFMLNYNLLIIFEIVAILILNLINKWLQFFLRHRNFLKVNVVARWARVYEKEV